MPAPIAPWMSASEALTIWMFRTAMKAPSVAPMTAIHILAETAGVAGVARLAGAEKAVQRVACRAVNGGTLWRAGRGWIRTSIAEGGGRKDCPAVPKDAL